MSIIKLNNRAVKDATAVGSITGLGNLVFISRSTASLSSSVSITSGIDSTYKEYIFMFNNIHPSNDSGQFQFNFSTDGGSNYNVTKTSAMFRAYHYENDAHTGLGYEAGGDLAQSTNYQWFYEAIGNDNDQSGAGFLHLFSPSDTTFVKHYISNMQYYGNGDFSMSTFIGGYANTTSAINAIDFKMSAGTFDSGTIDMYGVK
jgi:hypothetical protein